MDYLSIYSSEKYSKLNKSLIKRRHEKSNDINKIKTELENIENKLDKIKTRLKWSIRVSWIINILIIMTAIHLIFSAYADLQLNTSFNQRLNVLAPYIEEHDVKVLKSKWALMQNRADFEEINNYMETLAINKEIVLPKKLLE